MTYQPPPQWQQGYYQPQWPAQRPWPQVEHRTMLSRRRMNPAETTFHAIMTLMTAGLWGIVWYARARSRVTVTRYR